MMNILVYIQALFELIFISPVLIAIAVVGKLASLAGKSLDSDLTTAILPDPKAGSFAGKCVYITGASAGIGAELAIRLGSLGAKVILMARREGQLKEVARRVTSAGGSAVVLPVDLLDATASVEAVAGAIETHGVPDVLVLNAGRSQRALCEEGTDEDDATLFDLNVSALLRTCRQVLPGMLARGSGHMVVTSSVAGKVGSPVSGTYSATKFALQGYFAALRNECGARGIDVTMICPGPVHTEITSHFVGKGAEAPNASDQNDGRLSATRCAQLVTRAIAHKLPESWISHNPILLFTYSSYAPTLSAFIGPIVGSSRVKAYLSGDMSYKFISGSSK